MSNSSPSFGRLAASRSSTDDLLALERAYRRPGAFQQLDELVTQILARVVRGELGIELDREQCRVTFLGLSEVQRAFLDSTYGVARQEERGAWFIPRSASIHAGVVNLPAIVRAYGRFGVGMVWDWIERRDVQLASSADAVFAWSVVMPLMDDLFLPFRIRGPLAGEKTREEQLSLWDATDQLLRAIGFHLDDDLAIMRYGGGWARLRSAQQHAARLRLLDSLAAQVQPEMASRYRAYRLHGLLQSYYAKANERGQASRKQVVANSPMKATMSGFFGGDWLAFLSYLDEQPHPKEQVIRALPLPRLHVGGKKRAEELAEAQGVPVDEVTRVVGTLFKTTGGLSPVENRSTALLQYWDVFDRLHSHQRPGRSSLWGLVEDYGHIEFGIGPSHSNPRLYNEILPASLLDTIRRLWGTIMLPRWPERLVTEPFPHARLAEIFGPALRFWHGVSLTAWFVCEGPYSRTDIPGMSQYYERDILALEHLETPVDVRIFSDLLEADRILAAPKPVHGSSHSLRPSPGITVTFSTALGTRREGFEQLRDIITRHRRDWADSYLADYVQARWEAEIKAAHRSFSQLLADRGKPPTAKQFSHGAAVAANHWFGGNIGRLYEAIGEKPPIEPNYQPIIPTVAPEPDKFGAAVFRELGGDESQQGYVGNPSTEERRTHERQGTMRNLAARSLSYLQIEEATGEPPEMRDFGRGAFEWAAKVFGEEESVLWDWYAQAIDTARIQMNQQL